MPTHLTHWGAFEAESDGTRLTSVRAWGADPDPRDLIGNVASAQHHPTRVRRPAVRRGWLENGPGKAVRGSDPFVEVSWDRAIDLVAGELSRVYDDRGPSGIYGGSYGWSSAGRFHHAQSQIHRFLNTLGGYVSSVGDYSYGTSGVLLPHVIGDATDLMARATTWEVVSDTTDLFVSFGGLSDKNSAVGPGGVSRHRGRAAIQRAVERGCRFVDVSPIRDDTFPEAGAEWIAPRPATDSALMLAIAFILDSENLADAAFVGQYCVGYDRFASYVRGESDGIPKDPRWAEQICGVPASRITALAREMATSRTMINVSWSLQRQHHGEQPTWLGLTLASMLGQIGLPGGGFQHGYGSSADVGLAKRVLSPPSLPQGRNAETSYIPVARIADMLLHPGRTIEFNGTCITMPTVEVVYWAGGNPFHHHQDLARLRRAFEHPSTVIVHEQFWTSTARHADIVLPATMSIERDDFGAGRNDPIFFPMPALTAPAGEARDDYTIFSTLAHALGKGSEFTEGRGAMEWLRHLYEGWREGISTREVVANELVGTEKVRNEPNVPHFDAFWASEYVTLPVIDQQQVLLADFRYSPDRFPLPTPSGRIEIHSDTIARFGYEDCPGHPAWLEPAEWLGNAGDGELHLIANQPKARLHSQLDVGAVSQATKLHGREPARMHPADAAERGLSEGDIVRLFNERGSCLAGLVLTDAVMPRVVQLSTGAWYDPDPVDPSFCRHGNPNVLIADRPSSTLSQGTTAQHALVRVERWTEVVPDLAVHSPPIGVTPHPPAT